MILNIKELPKEVQNYIFDNFEFREEYEHVMEEDLIFHYHLKSKKDKIKVSHNFFSFLQDIINSGQEFPYLFDVKDGEEEEDVIYPYLFIDGNSVDYHLYSYNTPFLFYCPDQIYSRWSFKCKHKGKIYKFHFKQTSISNCGLISYNNFHLPSPFIKNYSKDFVTKFVHRCLDVAMSLYPYVQFTHNENNAFYFEPFKDDIIHSFKNPNSGNIINVYHVEKIHDNPPTHPFKL